MSKHLYYGETVALISKVMHEDPTKCLKIAQTINDKMQSFENTSTLCAQAGRVFHQIEDVCEDHFLDWDAIINRYALKIRNALMGGKVPNAIEFSAMAIQSIQKSS